MSTPQLDITFIRLISQIVGSFEPEVIKMDNYDYYLVTRPLFSKFERENGMPTIRKLDLNENQLNSLQILNFSNLKNCNSRSVISMFHHDKKLNCLWNNPLKYIKKFRHCLAVMTPDFTIQTNMDEELIRMNIYKNRWLGCTWQQYGIKIIPTISWADSSTYDICFSGIEKGTIVAVSTIGCQKENERKVFIEGFNELIRRKSPSIILVVGSLIKGMTGNLIPIDYSEGFNKKDSFDQLTLFDLSKILKIKEGETYGW